MKKIRCLIVDDEPIARKVLREFIERIPFLSACGQCENTMKAELFIKQNEADLILLDIEMPKLSGLEWLKRTPVKPMIILTTAFQNYALEGYELDIIDYLLKPIAFDRFLKAMQKVREYAEMREHLIAGTGYLFVRSDKRIEKIELKDVLYAESVGNYVHIVTTEKKLLAYLTLKSLEAQLPGHDFVKVHQSFLVNLSQIEAIDGNRIIIGHNEIPVSRSFRGRLMQIVEQRILRR
ncbi:LytTR family DNA-binding domain-containing protein [Mucilaginibacter panaciglaebae]|uniref:LytTR family DNA-binding domain-containing protein n=1 Tax=Mucilaginibacter panaciglaebae TaxID=502331 RepID=A0ABP7X191_9SPHI